MNDDLGRMIAYLRTPLVACLRVVIIDSEYNAHKGQGERSGFPWCICAIEIDQHGRERLHRLTAPYPAIPPWERGDPYVAIFFNAAAEAGSFMNVGWPFPPLAIDLYAEYMVIHNTEMVRRGKNQGESKLPGPSLIKACKRYRVPVMEQADKDDKRSLAYMKASLTPEEIAILVEYCLNDDCRSTLGLHRAMRRLIDPLRAPIRAAFMMEMERMRARGIPIDVQTYNRIKQNGAEIAANLRLELNRKLGANVYFRDVFKKKTMLAVMRHRGIPIPVDHKTKKYSCATKHIKSMIAAHPLLKEYYEDKRMIDAVKDLQLEIGADGRNRFWLNPFGTKTGRNNPSTNKCVLGLPHTMRSFIKPEVGMALAQVDVGAEEVGIAAALSGDPVLQADYRSGDPYRQFAAAALGVLDPTEQQRQIYKATVLGRIYGLGVASLARNLGISRAQAQQIMDQMDARYPVLNAWLQRILMKVAHGVPIVCALGWSLASTGGSDEGRTFLNYPMQANGAELMRLVIVRAGAAGLQLIGCAHDSFIIEAPIAEIDQEVARLQEIVRQASRDLFDGFELRADCKPERDIVRYPARFIDKREMEDGMCHWNRLMSLIDAEEEDVA